MSPTAYFTANSEPQRFRTHRLQWINDCRHIMTLHKHATRYKLSAERKYKKLSYNEPDVSAKYPIRSVNKPPNPPMECVHS